RVDEDAPVVVHRSTERVVHDVLQRLERLAAMTHEQLRLVAHDVQARAVGCFLDVDRRGDAEGADEALEKIDDGCGVPAQLSEDSIAHIANNTGIVSSIGTQPPAGLTPRSL